jgi:thiamine-phosphate pyrophosphorylase
LSAPYQPPALYLITDRHATAGRSLRALIETALTAALPFRRSNGRLPIAVSLREKDLSATELIALGGELISATRAAGADLFINGRLDIAMALGADGVHLPAQGILPQEARAAAPHLRVGLSTHDPEEVAAARGVDFVVYGPVFETPSKTGVLAPRGLDGLRAASNHGVPVLALGGITPANTDDCRAVGAAGVACIRAILGAKDVASATVSFLARFRR